MHQRAADADVIIVNHHLFFADLALRQDDFGSILPGILGGDFRRSARNRGRGKRLLWPAGIELSIRRNLARDAEQTLRVSRQGGPPLLRRVSRLRDRVREFFEAFPPRDGRSPFETTARAEFLERHRTAYEDLVAAVKSGRKRHCRASRQERGTYRNARRAAELRGEIKFLLESTEKITYIGSNAAARAYSLRRRHRCQRDLRERHFRGFDTLVLTSATLAVGGHFDFLKQRLGIHTDASAFCLTSSTSRARRCCTSAGLPDVRDASFALKAACRDRETPGMHRGTRVFAVYQLQPDESISNWCARVPLFPCFWQGTAPRTALLERFRTTPGAVLFATSSFWQGVDVPGDQLPAWIVDRLPFARA